MTRRAEPLPVPADDQGLRALLHELYGLERRVVEMDLGATRRTLDALGAPERAFAAVQIGGTNGKGSVSAMVAAGIAAGGAHPRVGLFTSPHLVDWRERVQIGGRGAAGGGFAPVDEAAALAAVRAALEAGRAAEARLSFFEVTTAAALVAFAHARVDVAVLEVGLGGRLDATTAVDPVVAAVVTVDRDHTEVLGETYAEIAREKAGIAKPGGVLISGVTGASAGTGTRAQGAGRASTQAEAARDPAETPVAREPAEARAALREEVARRGARLSELGADFRYEAAADGTVAYCGPRWRLDGLRVAMRGAHQRHNAAVALRVLEELAAARPALGLEDARAGIAAAACGAVWPGRFEVLERTGTAGGRAAATVVLDAAHNQAGAAAFAAALRQELGGRPVHLVYGAMGDKDARAMLRALVPLAAEATFVRAPGRRAADPAALRRLAAAIRKDLPARSAGDAPPAGVVLAALEGLPPGGVLAVTGSIYLLGAVRAALRDALGLPPEPALPQPAARP
ncbi:MAG TPA: cyanophycin synthetase [Myxococcota bacterium]|nr:cyanophycin synthetase [Myxococcota bacterium]